MPSTNSQTVWAVSALNHEIRTLLEQGIGSIWIEGEISNFSQPASGHWYFSLKDDKAQLRAAMFRNRNQRIRFKPQNGQQILVRAQVTLYEARGDFQVIIEHMEEAGTGQLMRQYEQLKQKLQQQGLFDASRKQAIPEQAQSIGIITSASGAAVRDALSVIRRRSPSAQVTVFPTQVQGEQASKEIIRAFEKAVQYHIENPLQVILLIRGGGSLEDLWCFNDEQLALTIASQTIPVVTGIGHEIDFTIADFVADFRAPTPSAAAEQVTFDQYEIMMRIDQALHQLKTVMLRRLQHKQQQLQNQFQRLRLLHPDQKLQGLKIRLQWSHTNLIQTMQQKLRGFESRVSINQQKIQNLNPVHDIRLYRETLSHLNERLKQSVFSIQQQKAQALALKSIALDQLSPLKTLSRGFAVVQKDNRNISKARQLSIGDQVNLLFQDGKVNAEIKD